jgi:DNA-binding transcriptional MerR regulator
MTSTTTATAHDLGPFSIQETSRRTGLSEPTLRYYEQVGIIAPVPRDRESGHRRFPTATVSTLQSLACLRAAGMPIDDMRRFIALLDEGDTAAGEQRDLFTQQAHRLAAEIARMQVQLGYLRAKAELWDARDRDDSEAERRAAAEVVAIADQLNTTGPAAGGANNKRKEQ